MTEPAPQREVWIALVGVSPKPGTDLLGSAKGAWVNVLAWASDPKEYRTAVHEALEHYGLDLIGIEDLEPLGRRLQRTVVDPHLLRLANEVTATGFARFGPFHTYEDDENSHSLVS